jgi:hypothetical protein
MPKDIWRNFSIFFLFSVSLILLMYSLLRECIFIVSGGPFHTQEDRSVHVGVTASGTRIPQLSKNILVPSQYNKE